MSSTRIVSFVIAALLIATCIADPLSAVADATPDPARPGVMTVTGTATLEIAPDCADLMMTISADDLKPSAATHAVRPSATTRCSRRSPVKASSAPTSSCRSDDEDDLRTELRQLGADARAHLSRRDHHHGDDASSTSSGSSWTQRRAPT